MSLEKCRELIDKNYQVTMEDGSVWAVPVLTIAVNRAEYFSEDNGITLQEAMHNDTGPLFADYPDEIEDWAKNNMDWKDVAEDAHCVQSPTTHFQKGWMNGDVEIV